MKGGSNMEHALDAGLRLCFNPTSRPNRRPLMTRLASLAVLLLATGFAGCAYPNQFRNVRADAPHAVLIGDGVTVVHISGRPTGFWRVRERFRVPPGENTLGAVAGHWDIQSYAVPPFTAVAGQTYFLRRQRADGSDRVVLRDRADHIVAQAERQTQ